MGPAPKFDFAVDLVERHLKATLSKEAKARIRRAIETDGQGLDDREEEEVCGFLLQAMALQCGATISVLGRIRENSVTYEPSTVGSALNLALKISAFSGLP